MPNIELYAGSWDDSGVYKNVAIAVSQLPFRGEIVLTDHCSTPCHSLNGKKQPFIRVCSTEKKEIDMIVEVLRPLGYDIETLVLTGFYPGEK